MCYPCLRLGLRPRGSLPGLFRPCLTILDADQLDRFVFLLAKQNVEPHPFPSTDPIHYQLIEKLVHLS